MPWVRFTDDYLANDKITPLSAYARLLDMAAIVYSARELRDGHLSMGDAETVAAAARVPRWQRAAAELVLANRWIAEPSGYVIHDYLDYQPSREHVLAEREAARVRKKSGRNSSGVQPDSERSSPEVQTEFVRSSRPPVPGNPELTRNPDPGLPTPNPFPSEGAETGAEPPSPRPGPGRRANGTNPRSTGSNPRATDANPRATADNPRALGTNPRRRRRLEFNEDGPRYEQRVGADGKREWVEVSA